MTHLATLVALYRVLQRGTVTFLMTGFGAVVAGLLPCIAASHAAFWAIPLDVAGFVAAVADLVFLLTIFSNVAGLVAFVALLLLVIFVGAIPG